MRPPYTEKIARDHLAPYTREALQKLLREREDELLGVEASVWRPIAKEMLAEKQGQSS